MLHNIQPLKTNGAGLPRISPAKNQKYYCAACEIEFMGYPGQSQDWPPAGQGVPPCCGDPDCADYLQNLSIMRGWVAENIKKASEGKIPSQFAGSERYVNSEGAAFKLTGHEALFYRVIERRKMVAMERGSGW